MEDTVGVLQLFCDDSAEVDISSIDEACSVLWAAAIGNRVAHCLAPDTPIPPNTQQLHELADNKQLTGHLAQAAVKATDPVIAALKASTAGETLNKASVHLAVQLLTTFATCTRSWMNYANDKDDWMMTMAIKMMLIGQVDDTGLARTLKNACLELAAALKQQQQQSESVVCTKLLASAVLHAVRYCILSDRPAQLLWDPVLSPIVLPAIQLAAALLPAYTGPPSAAAAAAAAGSSNEPAAATTADPAAAMFDAWVAKWLEDTPVGLEPVALSDHLSFAILRGYMWKPECFTSEQPLLDLMSSPDLQKLLLVNVAANAQYAYNKQRNSKAAVAGGEEASGSGSGSSDNQLQQENASKELQLPPSWHDQLYVECGLQSGVDLSGIFVLWDQDEPSLPPVQLLSVMMQLRDRFWMPRYREMTSAVGLMRVRADLQQQQGRTGAAAAAGPDDPEFVVQPQLRVSLLLVLIELLLLVPATKLGVIFLKMMSQLFVKGWCWDPDAAFAAAFAAVAAAGPTARFDDEACREVDQRREACPAGSLTSPVLLQLAPAYMHIVSHFDPAAEQDVLPQDMGDMQACFSSVMAVAVMADSLTGGEQLAAAFKQNPAAVSKALEAAVRASFDHVGTVVTLDTTNFVLQKIRMIYEEPSPAEEASLPNTYMPSEESPVGSSPRGSCQPLFGLLLSSLKFMAKVASEHGVRGSSGSSSCGPGPSPAVELLIHSTDILALLLVMSDLNDAGGGGVTSVRHRWLVLAGVAMQCWSQAVKDLLANSRQLLARQGQMPLVNGFIGHSLQSITNSVSWLGACLAKLKPAAADPAVLQQLQQLQSQIFEQLIDNVVPRIRPDRVDALVTVAQLLEELQRLLPARLLLQLQQLSEGVCALLPLPFCCSNPSCRVSLGLTESESVKGGRCSGCKVAHYHPACQKAHWPQHKATCKRLKAQPEAAQACIDAA